MSMPGNLSLEQRFRLQMMQTEVKSLDLEQAQGYVVELLRQMMVKDNLVKDILSTK